MRTTVNLDDRLLAECREITGISEVSALLREALRELKRREAVRRLVALDGSDPGAWAPNEGDEPPVR